MKFCDSEFFFPFQHQDSTLGDDEVFFILVENFGGSAHQENREVSFSCLQRHILYFLFVLFPWFFFWGKWNDVAGAGFYDIPLLHFFFLLYAWWQVQTSGRSLIGLSGFDEHPVTDDDEFFQPVIGSNMHELV